MISLILYGRNDSYGYNLHKRAALSLNCMAEVLSEPDDEILFVDYNTPDDFPTFPEAIQDTLTEKARHRLRILRARPPIHARYRDRTHLQALEPVARNIAVRRSNPANRWVLSTNTDMIFVPRKGKSLTEIVRDLPVGYYGIPRFELPESMWETLDRRDAPGTIETVGRWGWQFHLNESVYGPPEVRFDAPGDFQLVERSQLLDIHGFDEQMLLGWHVDSNLCKRLFLIYGRVEDLSDEVFGYHCDHTRQVTPAHKRRARENSLQRFVSDVDHPVATSQAHDWGCASDAIEEVRLSRTPGDSYLECLGATVPEPMERVAECSYVSANFDEIGYDASHVLPYLMDVLVSAPRSWSVGWFGEYPAMFHAFNSMWSKMGFQGLILVPEKCTGALAIGAVSGVRAASINEICDQADTFIFDFIARDGSPLGNADGDDLVTKNLLRGFYSVIEAEENRHQEVGHSPRRVIAINAVHNRFETLLRGHIEFARSPLSTRLRHGYVVPVVSSAVGEEWLPLMKLAPTAGSVAEGVVVSQLQRGYVLSGPGVSLTPGRYTIALDILPVMPSFPAGWAKFIFALLLGRHLKRSKTTRLPKPAARPQGRSKRAIRRRAAFTVEIQSRDQVLSWCRLSWLQLLRTRGCQMDVEIGIGDVIDPQPLVVSIRVWSAGVLSFLVKSVEVTRMTGDRQHKSLAA